jgi:hypothetical protein
MKRSPVLEFNSAAFAPVAGEERQTNPGIYGKSLAAWLGGELRSAGFETGELVGEDFGWCVPVKSEPYALYVACASTGEEMPQCRVFAFIEGGLLSRVTGTDGRAKRLSDVFAAVRRCLESASQIRDLHVNGELPGE